MTRTTLARWILTDAPGTPGYADYATLVSAASGAAAVATLDGDDRYNVIYSSGTTGSPKGIVHTHAIRAAYGTTFAAAFRMRPESVVMHAGSLIFNGALTSNIARLTRTAIRWDGVFIGSSGFLRESSNG